MIEGIKGGDDDFEIGNARDIGHEEGHHAHYRGHDLPPGGSRRFHRAREARFESDLS